MSDHDLNNHGLFDEQRDAPHYRGLPVIRRDIRIADECFTVMCLKDAADLLDLPDFADRFVEEDKAPYGMELWPASIALAEMVLSGEPGENRSAIELGCGLGLVSLAASRAAWNVTTTDYEEESLRFARLNARLSGVDNLTFAPLDWRDPPRNQKYELILAADVLYQLVDHAPILGCIETLLAPGGTALVADPHRGVADRFPDLARQRGFDVSTAEQSVSVDDEEKRIRIFTLASGASAS